MSQREVLCDRRACARVSTAFDDVHFAGLGIAGPWYCWALSGGQQNGGPEPAPACMDSAEASSQNIQQTPAQQERAPLLLEGKHASRPTTAHTGMDHRWAALYIPYRGCVACSKGSQQRPCICEL